MQSAGEYAESAAEARAAVEAQQLATAHTHVAREVHEKNGEKKVAADAITAKQAAAAVGASQSNTPFQQFKTALFG